MRRSKFTYDNVNLVKFRRNQFKYEHSNTTTQSVGQLIPFLWQYITPGESHKDFTKLLGRGLTPFIKAPIGNLIVDMQYYFVPFRIIWDHWEEFQGANKDTAWASQKTYSMPMLRFSELNWSEVDKNDYQQTILSHFGIPYGNKKDINALAFRAYALIWDEWFRNQNVQDPILIPKNSDDVILTSEMVNADFSPDNIYGKVAYVNKFRDRFTSMLPEPQKGIAPSLNFSISGDLPVHTRSNEVDLPGSREPILFRPVQPSAFPRWTDPGQAFAYSQVALKEDYRNYKPSDYGMVFGARNGDGFSSSGDLPMSVLPSNLWAVADNVPLAGSVTGNDLRMLMQSTVLLERMARSGTRYREILLSQWGVVSSDASLQVPEFLNGVKFPLQYHQVAQTSGSSDASRQANISSFAYYSGLSNYRKSMNDFGIVIGVSCIRQLHTYQQGVEKFFAYEDKFDFFNSVFGHISEQPVYGYEIYSLSDDFNKTVIGYQEAWSELRSAVSVITGGANSLIGNGVDVWHFGSQFDTPPVLSPNFVKETPVNVDRTLNVPSSNQEQFLMQYVTNVDAIKVLDLYSVGSGI